MNSYERHNKYAIYILEVTTGTQTVAKLGGVWDKHDHLFTMTDLFVERPFRGRGIGTHMMWLTCREMKARGVTQMEWSDCTEKYRQPCNLYLRLGAHYKHEDADPDMMWDLTAITTEQIEHALARLDNDPQDTPFQKNIYFSN